MPAYPRDRRQVCRLSLACSSACQPTHLSVARLHACLHALLATDLIHRASASTFPPSIQPTEAPANPCSYPPRSCLFRSMSHGNCIMATSPRVDQVWIRYRLFLHWLSGYSQVSIYSTAKWICPFSVQCRAVSRGCTVPLPNKDGRRHNARNSAQRQVQVHVIVATLVLVLGKRSRWVRRTFSQLWKVSSYSSRGRQVCDLRERTAPRCCSTLH